MARSQIEIDALDSSKKDDDEGDKAKRSSRKDRKERPSRASTASADRELRNRLVECFERISAALRNRGDDELADLVNEDAQVMASGLVSLTRPFRLLRMVTLAIVSFIEPVLAFGRIVRVVAGRWAWRRAQAAEGTDEQAPPQ